MHSSPEFRSLKAKIRVLCKQRRIRLEEFMKTFDVHRVKKIKVEQFKRALNVSGLQLSPGEVSTLLAKYRFPNDPSFMDYRRFCDLMDKVFTIKGLESKPEFKTAAGRTPELTVQKRFVAAPVSGQEGEVLARVKSKLLDAVTTKGIVLKDVFHDFDRSNAGKVTKTQFVRDILDIVELSASELTVLLKAYSDDLDVYYRALHLDICPGTAGAEAQAAIPRSPERRHFSAPAASGYGTSGGDADTAVRELEASLSEIATRDRIRTKNFFVDFDPLRTGKCTEAQFRRCVKLCFAFVAEPDLDALVAKYTVKSLDTTKVDYIRFCQCINAHGVVPESRSSDNNDSFGATAGGGHDDILASLAAVTFNNGSGVRCTRELRGTLSDSEQETHRGMLQRLSGFCNTRRILLKPSFQDFDRGRREHITVEQFFRVMAMFKLTLSSEIERRVLLRRYESAYGERFVNYVNFCYDLEHWDAGTQSVARPSSSHVGSEIISPTKLETESFEESAVRAGPRPVPMLLRYIQVSVKRDRVRLDEYYRDFDKLRHGKVTSAQFRAGLNAAGLVLSSEEMDLLGDTYACDEVDSLGKHWVAWNSFVEDVDSVFTVKGLERAPRHDLSALQTRGEQFGGTKLEMELTPEQERVVTRTVRSIKQAIDRQRLDIKPAFEDFDRSRQGFISATKFERVLSMFALLPAEAAQARLLLVKFREQSAKGTGTTLTSICDVNFRAFLQALDLSSASGEDGPDAVVLPTSVAYRQKLYSTGRVAASVAARHDGRERAPGLAALAPLLAELRRQLSAKRIRIKEFVVEGDKLRTGEITVAKFHTALNRSGCVLTDADVQSLDQHFRSAKNADKIDWRRFLDAMDFSHDMSASTSANTAASDDSEVGNAGNSASEQVQRVLERLRVEVNHRRLHMKPYFQDYDRNKIGRVTKFQFAAVLDMMKVDLSPRDVQALAQQFAFRDGRAATADVNYLGLIVAVDSVYSK